MTDRSHYGRTGRTGNGSGDLDAIDGAGLLDDDRGYVNEDGLFLPYYLDDDYGGTADGYNSIVPVTNPGTKRWRLIDTMPKAARMGFSNRPLFSWTDADTIVLGPGAYHVHGASDRIVYWDNDLTIDLTGLSADTFYYLYIDESAITDPEITASEITESTTAPTWSDSKNGRYNGNDRCIFGFETDGSGDIPEFWHDGGDLVHYADYVQEFNTTLGTSWTNVTLSVPAFVTQALIKTYSQSTMYWRPDGSSAGGMFTAGSNYAVYPPEPIFCNDSQVVEIKNFASAAAVLRNCGWFFPRGM